MGVVKIGGSAPAGLGNTVKDEDVDDKHGELHQESHEEAYEARRLRLFVVVVQLKQVAFQILIGHVNDADQEEVKGRSDAVPRNELANTDREGVDVLLR